MRNLILSLLLLLPFTVAAQESSISQHPIKFGYLSYEAVLKAMPEYEQAQQSIAELRKKYDDEVKRVEDDFNTKYEQFLEGQKSFPKSILQKRQNELQEIMERNIKFKGEARQQLRDNEQQTMGAVRQKLDEAIKRVGQEKGYAFILNTDNGQTPFVNPQMGDDLTEAVKQALR